MEKSRKAAAINTTPYECGEGELPDNFRPYDQGQDFFVNVSKKAFLDAEHPAAVIDRVVERLDLKGVYAAYSKEGKPTTVSGSGIWTGCRGCLPRLCICVEPSD
jgi:hypothetical protein